MYSSSNKQAKKKKNTQKDLNRKGYYKTVLYICERGRGWEDLGEWH